MSMPKQVKLFRRVGAELPHVAQPGETMSWGNSEHATYAMLNNEQIKSMIDIIDSNDHHRLFVLKICLKGLIDE